jgi:hypothetical protein
VHGRAVAAVGLRGGARDRAFHRRQDPRGEAPAAGGVEGDGRAGGGERVDEACVEVVGARVAHVLRAFRSQQLGLLGLAHDVHERDAVLAADAVQHPAEVRRRRGVRERPVPVAAHGLDHAERGQRIDEARRAGGRRRALGQRQAVGRLQHAVLRVHRAADRGHGAAEQRARRRRVAGLHHGAGALVAHRQRLAHAARDAGHRALGDPGDEHRPLARARSGERRQVGRTEQQPEVGRIDRRCLHAQHDLVRAGGGHGRLVQPDLERGVGTHEGAQLQAGADGGVHRCLLEMPVRARRPCRPRAGPLL